jgi:hypothetical protein
MFGTKTNQVFTSRWKALSWSLGVIVLAYCSVPAAETEAQRSETATANAALALPIQTKAMPGVDPWADPRPMAATPSQVDQAMEKVAVLEKFGN